MLYAVSLVWQLGILIVVAVGGFMFLGQWCDKIFKTSPLFLIIGVILGIIIAIHGAYRFFLPLIGKKSNLRKDN